MLAEQIIDFNRGDPGWIVFWVCFPVLFVARAWRKRVRGDRRQILKVLGIQMLVGFFVVAVLVGLLSVWVRVGPQYFVKLRLEEKAVALKFRGAATEVEIPLRDIKSITIVKSGTYRHPWNRLQIKTSSQKFESLGFHRLADDQVVVLDAFRSQVGAEPPPKQQ